MCRKLICLSFVLMLGLIGSASADTIEWMGTVDTSWGNSGNWNPAQVPTSSDVANFWDASTGTTCLVNSNQSIKVLYGPGYRNNAVLNAAGEIIGGSESTLTIDGATLTVTVYAWPAYDANGWGVVNVESGGTLDIAQTFYLGNNGTITLNMNGGTVNAAGLRVGVGTADSLVNLDSGTVNVNSLGVGSNGVVDITGGTLNLIGGDRRGTVAGMTYDGDIVAYGGRGRVVAVYDTVSDPCQTIVTGTPDLTMAYDPNIVGVTGVVHDALLSWKPGDGVVSHTVYLSTEFNDVNSAVVGPTNPSYLGNYAAVPVDHNYVDDAFLEFGSTIYWRVDEVGVSTTSRGNIWRFSTDNGQARNPKPADLTVNSTVPDVNVIDLEFEWDRAPGRVPYPVKYNVYFSESYDEVNDVAVDNTAPLYCIGKTQDANAISRSVVKLNTTYYWRVDTKATADPCTVRGPVWSCKTRNYYEVDTFESYSTSPNLRSYWVGTGVEGNYHQLNMSYPYTDLKSVAINYYTYFSPYYGGIKRTHVSPTKPWNLKAPTWVDWTFSGTADALSLWFSPGPAPNLSRGGIDQLYARITDSSSRVALIHYTDNWPVSNLDNGGYQEWNIALQEFKDDNPSISLTNVKSLEFGYFDGLGTAPAIQDKNGWMYVDQIRLYARRCISRYGLPNADLNNDCLVNGDDLEIMANDWLHFDYSMDARPVSPTDPNLVAHWKLDEDIFSLNAEDSSSHGHDATIIGSPTWDPNGRIDGAIKLIDNGIDDYLDAGGGKELGDPDTWADITGDITVTAWVRPEFTTWWQNLNSVVNKGREEGWELHKSVTNVARLIDFEQTISFYVKLQGEECPWHGIHALTDIWDQKWHHVAGVYKIYQPRISPDQPGMSEILVYTDGVKEASYACGGTSINSCDWPVGIGTNIETAMRTQYRSTFYGHLDDVRIYNRALDHDEIVGLVKEGNVGPLVHYPFDDGTANDVSGNNKHGTLVDATIVYDADRDSNVLDVGDVNGYVDCGGGHALSEPNCTDTPANCTWADILGEFTVMAWVKPSLTNKGAYCGTVVSKGDWDGGYRYDDPLDPNARNREGWSMVRRGWENKVSVSMVGSANVASFFTPNEGIDLDLIDVNVWDGKWHHIAAVYDNLSTIDVYVDGLHAGSRYAKGYADPQTIGTCNYPIFIGASSGEIRGGGDYGDPATGFKGLIDDVRIYDRSLTQIEIASVMANADLYVPLDSLANLYDQEGMNSKIINFRDYQLLATEWLEDTMFPFVP